VNDVKFLEQSPLTEVHIGTMIHLREEVSTTAKIYMLVESDFGKAILVNLSDGRVWSHTPIITKDGAVSYPIFKDYCFVDFTFIHTVGVVTGTRGK
jgi:hypothetical protein